VADKTWREHVRDGEPFDMPDRNFLEAIFAAKAKATAFNNSAGEADLPALQRQLHDLFGKVGEDVIVVPPVTVDVGFNVEIGDGTFINANATLLDTYPIRIGRRVMIGPNCSFYPVGHPLRAADRLRVDAAGETIGNVTTGDPITIGDEVWIGGNVVVLPGVTIGDRTTIGAGSVVTKSIPADVFAAGNPCRVIRTLV